jgi:hypothetical protein
MATPNVTPETHPVGIPGNIPMEVSKTVFDLDSKGEVVVRKVGEFAPVENMEQFVARLNSDAALILKLANKALESYTEDQLASDENVLWQLVEEDENGNEVLSPFSGTLLSPEKSKGLNATVINLAKVIFGYAKQMVPGDVEKNRAAKKAAKEQALNMILSNPAAVEGLRK